MEGEELAPSELGTKDYWEKVYEKEEENFKDHEDPGEIWFGEGSLRRVWRWMLQCPEITFEDSIIDIGCGNGLTLIELADRGFQKLTGIDYSMKGIKLANEIAKKNDRKINFKVLDILRTDIKEKFRVVHDKGTYDAISLSENGKQARQTYIKRISNLTQRGGFLIITSCNWTQPELEQHLEGEFCLKEIIPTPELSFGGKKGKTVTCLVFIKI